MPRRHALAMIPSRLIAKWVRSPQICSTGKGAGPNVEGTRARGRFRRTHANPSFVREHPGLRSELFRALIYFNQQDMLLVEDLNANHRNGSWGGRFLVQSMRCLRRRTWFLHSNVYAFVSFSKKMNSYHSRVSANYSANMLHTSTSIICLQNCSFEPIFPPWRNHRGYLAEGRGGPQSFL